MLRPLGLPRLAAGFAVLPFAAMLAASCGGSDLVDPADSGHDSSLLDSTTDSPPSDGTLPDTNLPDTNADTNAPDTGLPETGIDAEAGPGDAGVEAEASVLDAGIEAEASVLDAGFEAEASVLDAGIEAEASILDAGFEAEASLPDAGDGGLGILGSVRSFAVLGGSTVTITAAPPSAVTTIVGDVGVFPGTSIATLSPGQPVGNIYAGGPIAAMAQADLTVAYNTLAGMACLPANNMTGVDLGGKTLAPAVYCFPNTSAGLTGNLVLDAQGNPNAVWVFQIGSTLTTATTSTVTVINGGSACNVYWQVGSSATLGTGTRFEGTVIALASVTMVTGATLLPGRALARNGAVSLDANSISVPPCQ